jgi:FtsP/CotA-like multicopper oxidase with cupredoxin domain
VPASSAKFTGTRRNFKFDRNNGQWTINGIPVDTSKPSFTIPRNGGPEIWTISGSGGWWHPIHIHFEEGIILTRDGKPTPFANEVNCRKDVFLLRGSETIEIYYQGFRDFHGHYVMHCHNTVHEDHAMMLRWDIA